MRALCLGEGPVPRRGHALIRLSEELNARIVGRKGPHQIGGSVVRPVVHDQNLNVGIRLILDGAERTLKEPVRVVGRNENGDQRGVSHGSRRDLPEMKRVLRFA